METKKLSKRTLVAYACGDFASHLCWTFVGGYLSVFYTDVVGLTPAVTAAILLIARIWDGINDPMFGAIAQRTNTKKGRFRPYIFYGAPLLALFSMLTFTTFGSGNTVIIWAAVTYIGCGMLYTVVNLSYGSLSTVMTTDPEAISQLNSWRMMGTNVSAIILNAITAPLLMRLSGDAGYTTGGYIKVAVLYAICAVPLFYFVYANCKEVVQVSESAYKVSIGKSIRSVLTNKPLMLIFCFQLMGTTAIFGRRGVMVYYMIYNLQRYDLIAIFMSLPSVFTVLGILITKNSIIRVGKKKMAAAGYIGAGITLILIYIAGMTIGYTNISLLLVLHCILGFFDFAAPIPLAMIVDAINYEEERKGIRSDGLSYATVSLSTKLGNAFGVSGALMVMGATGYVANVQQSVEVINGINLTTNLIFGILFLLCLIPLSLYPLNEKRSAEILASLERKRNK